MSVQKLARYFVESPVIIVQVDGEGRRAFLVLGQEVLGEARLIVG